MYSRRSASRADPLRSASPTLPLTQDDALSVLEYWQANAERLMLVYRGTDEQVTRIGHGRVRNATARELRIDMDRGRLHVTMHSAAFEFRTLTPGANGLLIRAERDNWIFLRSAPVHPATPRRA